MDDGFNLYRSMGGTAACRKLSTAFYGRVARDPVLRPFFPGRTFKCAIEELTAFLAQLLGGSPEDTQRRWWLSLRESHLRFRIGRKERDAWLRNMMLAFDDVGMAEPARSALADLFGRGSAYVVNAGPAPVVWETAHPAIAAYWNAQLALDEAVAAVRGGAAERAVALAEGSPFHCNRPVFAALLGLMLASGDATMTGYVRKRIEADAALGQERYSGRTLLHAAAAAGDSGTVELLLRTGAMPGTMDDGGHTPLYSVANECKVSGGADVVRALVRAGAKVDACDGVKHCTALHMAARRGNVEVAEALLQCGAGIEMRDSLGETPLRRAVNCDKTGVAALLLTKGADRHSAGSKGLTPFTAARSKSMRALFDIGTSLLYPQ